MDTGAEALIASCPCCEVQFRVTAEKTGNELPIIDLAHLAADGLGIEHPDPTEYAMELWGTFEAMIYLLKPEAMAGLYGRPAARDDRRHAGAFPGHDEDG